MCACVCVAQNAHIWYHLRCTSLWSPTLWLDLYVCVSGCNCVSMILFWVFVFCISTYIVHMYVYVCVYVCVLHRSVLMSGCILPRPPTLWLARRVWNLPLSLLLCLPGRRIFWSINFHDCCTMVFDNIFVRLKGLQSAWCSMNFCFSPGWKFKRGHRGFSF